MYTVPVLVSTGYEKVQLQVRRLQRACNKNCFSCLGHPQSVHAMLSPFFQPCYSTVLNEKSINLLPFFSRCAAVNHYNATDTKIGICEFQLHYIEFNVSGIHFSIKQLRGKNRERYRTGPDQLYPRAFALRPNRVLFVLAIFKRVIDEKMLAFRLRTSAT